MGGKVFCNPSHFQPEGRAHGSRQARQGAQGPAGYVPRTVGGGDLRLTPDDLQLGDRPHLSQRAESSASEQPLRSKRGRAYKRRRDGNEGSTYSGSEKDEQARRDHGGLWNSGGCLGGRDRDHGPQLAGDTDSVHRVVRPCSSERDHGGEDQAR